MIASPHLPLPSATEIGLLERLEYFFDTTAPLKSRDHLLCAFSSGPDSTALLAALNQLRRRQAFSLTAAHLDHGLDPESAQRADHAVRVCSLLEVPLVHEAISVPRMRRPGESLEAAARRLRYAFLDRARRRLNAKFIATAHHRDDQLETVLLRLLFGSGIAGLAGMRARRDRILRPVLEVPRRDLLEFLASLNIQPRQDPTNADLAPPRNRIRHLLLPWLQRDDPMVESATLALARTAGRFTRKMERWLERHLDLEPCEPVGCSVAQERLSRLPYPLWEFALAAISRRAGQDYPPRRKVRAELHRQVVAGHRVGCSCRSGWAWTESGGRLRYSPRPEKVADFTYTLDAPGERWIVELGVMLRMSRGPVEPWMFRGHPQRVGLAMELGGSGLLSVRNRRPGDRLQPLGSAYRRRLKDVLIERGVERERRDRIPLLCWNDDIAWVPGVTIDERFRIANHLEVWVAEIEER